MKILTGILAFFILAGADSFAQSYRYVDKNGVITFTDNAGSTLVKDAYAPKDDTKKARAKPAARPEQGRQLSERSKKRYEEYRRDPDAFVAKFGYNPFESSPNQSLAMPDGEGNHKERQKNHPETVAYTDYLGNLYKVRAGDMFQSAPGGIYNSRTGEFLARTGSGESKARKEK